MKRLNVLIRKIDIISHSTGKIIPWLVLILTAMLGYEITARYVFNAPTKWAFDLSYMVGGSFFLLGEAYALKEKRHVRIDIFYSRFSRRTKALINSICYLLFFFPLWGGLCYALVPYVRFSWEMGERSMQGYWQPVIYPFKTVMLIGVFLFLLQGIAEFLKHVQVLVRGGEIS